MRQRGHKKCHEDLGQFLSLLQTKLSELVAEENTSYEKCFAQQETAQVGGKDIGRGIYQSLQPLFGSARMSDWSAGSSIPLLLIWI